MGSIITGGEDLAAVQRELLRAKGFDPAAIARIERSLGPAAVHVDQPVENLLVKYENNELIADRVMPVLPTTKKSNVYFQLKPETAFTVPDARLSGQEALPNRAGAALDANGSFKVVDYALMDFISTDEEANADAPLEPRMVSEDALMDYLMLAREQRVANVVLGASNYGGNTSALSGSNRWDNSLSNPVTDIQLAIRTPLRKPNTMVLGWEAWDALRVNAALTKYIISRASTQGGATPLLVDQKTVADAFGLDRVLVGEAKVTTSREGATAAFGYVWGKSCALIRVEPRPSPRRTQTFGYTFRFSAGGTPPFGVQAFYQQLPGIRGGTYVKIGHSDADQVVGGQYVGYLLTTVIS
jgi:hypothetical protein